MSTKQPAGMDIKPVPRDASAQEAAWLVFQHIGDDRHFPSESDFWRAYGDALREIGTGYVPRAHSQRKSIMYANREGWLIHGDDGSIIVKLELPSWEREHAQAS